MTVDLKQQARKWRQEHWNEFDVAHPTSMLAAFGEHVLSQQSATPQGISDEEPIAWTTGLALETSRKLAGTPHGLIDACAENIWGDKGIPLYGSLTGEARIAELEGAARSALGDMEWAERAVPGTNFQSSIILLRAALSPPK